jgi:hypothetical protein
MSHQRVAATWIIWFAPDGHGFSVIFRSSIQISYTVQLDEEKKSSDLLEHEFLK